MEAYQQLEVRWAEFNDLDPQGIVACSSGTAALHLALEAMRLPQGSQVIVPDFTMISCARTVMLAGLQPLFVDCKDNLLMDFGLIPPCSPSLKALMVVHIYGRRWPVEWLPPTWGIRIIEDLAEAHGVKPSKQTNAACWSFYKNKIVAGEEGGAVWFKDLEHAALARQLRSLGFTEAHDFNHIPRGHNYRMSNAHAELILFSLRNYEDNLEVRRRIESVCERECPLPWRMPRRDAPWVYDLRIKEMTSVQQNEIISALKGVGVQARHAFKPMSQQPEFSCCRAVGPERQWGSCMAAKEVIYLPLTPGQVTEEQIVSAFKILRNFFPEKA